MTLLCLAEKNGMDPPQCVQRGVGELVEAALTPRNLCMMDPTAASLVLIFFSNLIFVLCQLLGV